MNFKHKIMNKDPLDERLEQDFFLKMFNFLLNKTKESKPINKGYRDNKMSLEADNSPKIITWLPSNRGIWYIQ